MSNALSPNRGGFMSALSLSAMVALLASSMLPGVASAAIVLPLADILIDIALIVAFIIGVGGAVLAMIYVARGFTWAKKAG